MMMKQMTAAIAVAAMLLAGAGCRGQKPATCPCMSGKEPVALARVNAGAAAQWADNKGNVWLPDKGFVGGDTVDRGNIPIGNTDTPEIYRTEHYSMKSFSWAVPNGKYVVKLHFCETYDGITGAGQRVFDVDVEGVALKDIDVFAQAGGARRALVKTVEVTVNDGKLDITFTPKTQNPEINAIEILAR